MYNPPMGQAFQFSTNLRGTSLAGHLANLDGPRNSLRCLSQPSVMASIALLLINDHVLKVLVPSFLTGKLSDFAGLYFFPFLLALPLSLLIDRSGLRSRFIGGLSILLTALLFTLIKTSPAVNASIVRMLTAITGRSAAIVLDPTDLIALGILLPAWRLWQKVAERKPATYAWLVFGIASMASMATSCLPIDSIARLVIYDNVIYALSSETYFIGASLDQGLIWQDPDDIPDAVWEQFDQEPELPKVVCYPQDPQQCYRITGKGIVESSIDGGSNWEVAWQVPPGRREFMDRVAAGFLCGKSIDLGPYDLTLVGSPENPSAVVAMGNEGVLVLAEDGSWSRLEIEMATPTPFSAESLFDILWVLRSEFGFLIFIAFFVWVVFNIMYGGVVLRKLTSDLSVDQGAGWILEPFKISVRNFLILLIGGVGLAWLSTYLGNLEVISWILFLLIPLVFLVGYFRIWKRLKRVVPNPRSTQKALPAIFLLSLGTFAFGFTPLLFWSLNVISQYQSALLIAKGTTLASVLLGVVMIRSLARRTIVEQDPNNPTLT